MDAKKPYVRVVNSPWNGRGYIKRKKAAKYVTEGRGTLLDASENQMLLDTAHPKNNAAAARAATGYDSVRAGFRWFQATSDGATVMQIEKKDGL